MTQEILHSIQIENLKNLRNITIDFDKTQYLTAIMGVNGSGKSTILHALACSFKKPAGTEFGEDRRFPYFFTPTTNSQWLGSNFTIKYSFRENEKKHNNLEKNFKKTDRWTRYEKRPIREVCYIGIDSCVPTIEKEKYTSHITFLENEGEPEGIYRDVLEKAAGILNKNYVSFFIQRSLFGGRYNSVEINDIKYSELSMGAGEQRLFKILEKVFRAPKYALILIDELDLLLHPNALKKLLKVMHDRASLKNLQIIFTTHSPMIANEEFSFLGVRHIHQIRDRTFCFNDTKPAALERLTGENLRPLQVYCEDLLSKRIIFKIAEELRLNPYLEILLYGPCFNAINLACYSILIDEDVSNRLFVLDGDTIASPEEKKTLIKKSISGDDPNMVQKREDALTLLGQFSLPTGISLEMYIFGLIRESNRVDHLIVQIAREINACGDKHDYLNEIVIRMGEYSEDTAYHKMIELISETEEWTEMVGNVKEWFSNRQDALLEN